MQVTEYDMYIRTCCRLLLNKCLGWAVRSAVPASTLTLWTGFRDIYNKKL